MKNYKYILLIICLVILCSCGKKKEEDFSKIKNGELYACPNYSIDELTSNYLKNPVWKKEKSDLGYEVYNVSGILFDKKNQKEKEVILQFAFNRDEIILKNYELEKIDQSEYEVTKLIGEMCEYTKNELTLVNNKTTLNYLLLKTDFYDSTIFPSTYILLKDIVEYYEYNIDYELNFAQKGNFKYEYRIELENVTKNTKEIVTTYSDNINNLNNFSIKYSSKVKHDNDDNYKINVYVKVDGDKKFKKDEFLLSTIYIENSKSTTSFYENVFFN